MPFGFTLRMMSVLTEASDGKATLLTKGAPEQFFHPCPYSELNSSVPPWKLIAFEA